MALPVGLMAVLDLADARGKEAEADSAMIGTVGTTTRILEMIEIGETTRTLAMVIKIMARETITTTTTKTIEMITEEIKINNKIKKDPSITKQFVTFSNNLSQKIWPPEETDLEIMGCKAFLLVQSSLP